MQCVQGHDSPLSVANNRTHSKVDVSKYSNLDKEIANEKHGNFVNNNCAVFIRNLCKQYEEGPPILQNFCMNVKKGSIYGLLGASGCGKSTVLTCIVGLRKWDSGELLVFGKRPGTKGSGIPGKKLGYMPQDLSLYSQLSIREIIQFYGRLYAMPTKEIAERWRFLNKLLELPATLPLIADLSGGQQRRASLALALIHTPDLLILDEPTVGLDPLLRTNIWDHLYKIGSKLGTTIIITTHYIEEARLSGTIGVMRKGRLLVEETPSSLLESFKCTLLEDVVLHLCRQDESNVKNLAVTDNSHNNHGVAFKSSWTKDVALGLAVTSTKEEKKFINATFCKTGEFDCEISQRLGKKESYHGNNVNGYYVKLCDSELFSAFRRIYGFTTVILLTLIRNPSFLGLTLFMPTIQGSSSLLSLGHKPRGLHVGIVNNELPNWTSECHLSNFNGSSCDFSMLSCMYLNQLQKDDMFVLDSFDTEEEALSSVHLGKTWGYLTIPDNYSQHTMDFAAAMKFAGNESLEGSRIRARFDHSLPKASVWQLRDNYTDFIIPGIILSSLIAIGFALTGMIVVADRKAGTLSRAHVAGMTTADVLVSHLITQGFITVGQIIIWIGVLQFLFNYSVLGSIWLWVLFCFLTALCGAGIGVFLGQLCKEEIHILMIAIFLFAIFICFGCVLFPFEGVSKFWQKFTYLLPTMVPTLSLRSITARGLGLASPFVWSGLAVIIAWTVILLILSAVFYKKN